MNRQRGLQAGIFVFLILTGCSKTDKKLNVEGAFSPVIENLRSAPEPPVRGDVNTLTAIVKNPRGYAIRYHWSTGAGTVPDSTGTGVLTGDTTLATVHWTAPPAIGNYPVTVTITAHDEINDVDFVKTRTFYLHVDNEFVRWTRSIALQFDVVPPTAGRIYYSEVRNSSTGESDIWALATPLGSPEQITHDFWQTTQATVQSDGSHAGFVVFMGKKHSSDGGASIYQLPPTGGDTTAASILLQWTNNANLYVGGPRFAPSGSMLAYSNDTIPESHFYPKGWMRDAGNLATAPIPITPTAPFGSEQTNSYWNPAWRGTGDSLVMESYSSFPSVNRASRGLFKFSATGNPPTNPDPFSPWLSDLQAFEPDWSPDGQHIVFSKRSIGHTDRDIWIINAAASDPSAAVQVTVGPADDFHPRFSSDGSQIFFVSNRVDGYGANGVYDTERRGLNIWCVGRFDKP